MVGFNQKLVKLADNPATRGDIGRPDPAGEYLPLCVPKTLFELMTRWNRRSWRNDRAALFVADAAIFCQIACLTEELRILPLRQLPPTNTKNPVD
jgi:hypothetical protein